MDGVGERGLCVYVCSGHGCMSECPSKSFADE
jgi:hypothetical protein